jgi:hypothetical protein
LSVKRGWNGGFFTRKPEATSVARVAGHYLRSQGTTFGDVWRTQSVIGAEAARMAGAHPEVEARRALLDMVEAARPDPDDPDSGRRLARLRLDFAQAIIELVQSETIQLLMVILIETTKTASAARWFMEPDQQAFTYEYLERTAAAIADGDSESAGRHYSEFCEEAFRRFGDLMNMAVGGSAEGDFGEPD